MILTRLEPAGTPASKGESRKVAQWRARFGASAIAAALVVTLPLTAPQPASAQDQVSEARLRKMEAEIRALQRNVFPGGDGTFFEPQITAEGPDAPPRANTSPAPSTSAVTDILARLDAIELQLQRLTALSEENLNSIALATMRIEDLESAEAARLASAANPASTAADPTSDEEAAPAAAGADRATPSNLAAMGAVPAGERASGAASMSDPSSTDWTTPGSRALPPGEPSAPAPRSAGPSDERLAAVKAITKPQTDDEADDEYSYGFRLWDAGFYPEARQQLAKFVEDYPSHWRATYGRNLLGRAYLDDRKPEDAARWFLRNYQAGRTDQRAPDSLLFLAESMIALEDDRRACIALAEFAETYPAIATGRLMEQYQANRAKVVCES